MPAGTFPAGIFAKKKVERGVSARNPHDPHSLLITSQRKTPWHPKTLHPRSCASGRTGTVRST